MGKNQSASGLTNIVQYDTAGNISLVSGSTTLLYISSSGAIITTGVISGSNALSASYSISASNALAAQTASYVQNAQSASYVLTAQTASFVLNAQSASYVLNAQSASNAVVAQTASYILTAQTASFVANAQSASNAVAAQTASYANNLTVAGTLTAQTLVVQTITSSVDFVTGSTRFGSLSSNTHQFTGSVGISGSLSGTSATFNSDFTQNETNKVGISFASGYGQINSWGANTSTYGGLKFQISVSNGATVNALTLLPSGAATFISNVTAGGNITINAGNGNQLSLNNAGERFTQINLNNNSVSKALIWWDDNNTELVLLASGSGTGHLKIASTGVATFASNVNIDGERLTIGGTTNNAIINNIASVRINIDCDNNNAGESFMIGHNQTGIDNNNVLFKVQDDGKVGIGTNSPSTLLHLNATTTQLTLQNTDGGTNAERAGLFMTGGDTFKLISLNDNNTTRTDNILVANVLDGKVGIGASTPSAQGLTIYQGGSDRRIMLELNRPNSPGLQSAIQFTVGNSIMVGQIQHEYAGSNLNHMSFSLRSPGGGDFVSMWLQNSGYVGIGNSNPATKLNVNNTVVGALLPYINGTGLSYNSEGISVAGSNTNNTNIGNGLTLFNNVASVGAYSPVIAFSSMTSGGAYNATYAFISGVYQGAGGDANWSKGDMIFGTGNSYGATMRLKLTQDGALLPGADNSYGFGGSGIRWAAIWAANGTIQTSDEREKKDIINTDLGLDFINKLRPVSYKWKVGQNEVVSEFDGMNEDGTPKYKSVVKPREGKRTHYGLIAQEVESLLDGKDFGGFVHDKETDIMGLRYDQFVPLLIKSIQELNTKLDAANVEIEALKAK